VKGEMHAKFSMKPEGDWM